MSRRQKTTSEYFVADRRIPGWVVAFTLVGTMISSMTLIGHPGAVFARNMWNVMGILAMPVVLLFVAWYIVPFYRRVVGMSAYEYLSKRFGTGARVYSSTGFLLGRIVDIGFTLYTTSIAAAIMTGWDIRWVVVVVGTIIVLYTLVGGIEGVVWIDVVQGVVLVSAALTIIGTVLFTPSQGPSGVLAAAWKGGKFQLGDFDHSWSSLFKEMPTAWMLLFMGFISQATSYITQQNMVQRYLIARTDKEAMSGMFVGALACAPIWVTFMFIGACLFGFYQVSGHVLPPEIANQPDSIVPYFVSTQLPAGLVGLILAAILGQALSSMSADLNSIATVATADYFSKLFPQSSDRRRLTFGRAVVIVAGAACVGTGLALTLTRSRAAFELFVILTSILTGGVLGLFALGWLTRRANRIGAYSGIVACLLFTTWATLTGPFKQDWGFNYRLNPLTMALATQLVLFGVGYLVSRIWPDPTLNVTGMTVWDARLHRGTESVRPSVKE
jgi:SSS family solute:Na+ symporter